MSLEDPSSTGPHGEATVDKSLFCFPNNSAVTATSCGIFVGDNPLKFYFPLLLYHACIVFALSRAVHALLRRANVPLVISQILVRLPELAYTSGFCSRSIHIRAFHGDQLN
jgi:hypothetical protein